MGPLEREHPHDLWCLPGASRSWLKIRGPGSKLPLAESYRVCMGHGLTAGSPREAEQL